MKSQYKIVTGSKKEVEVEVSKLMSEDWDMAAGLQVTQTPDRTPWFHQAMIKIDWEEGD